MKADYMKQIIPAILIFLFAYTAGSKLADFSFFSAQLSLYPYIKEVAVLTAVAIPLLEIATILLLLFPSTRKTGLWASLLLLVVFTVYLIVMVITQSNLPCSCGGVIQKMTWQQHILFNLFFIFLSIIGLRLERDRKNQTQPLSRIQSSSLQ